MPNGVTQKRVSNYLAGSTMVGGVGSGSGLDPQQLERAATAATEVPTMASLMDFLMVVIATFYAVGRPRSSRNQDLA